MSVGSGGSGAGRSGVSRLSRWQQGQQRREAPTQGRVVVADEPPGDESYGQCCKKKIKNTPNAVTAVSSNSSEAPADRGRRDGAARESARVRTRRRHPAGGAANAAP